MALMEATPNSVPEGSTGRECRQEGEKGRKGGGIMEGEKWTPVCV